MNYKQKFSYQTTPNLLTAAVVVVVVVVVCVCVCVCVLLIHHLVVAFHARTVR